MGKFGPFLGNIEPRFGIIEPLRGKYWARMFHNWASRATMYDVGIISDLPTSDKGKKIWRFYKKSWDSIFFPIKIKQTPFPLRKVIIEKSPPLFAMFIRLRSLSRAELTKTTGKLNMGDAWELDLVPRAYSSFKMADRHEEKRLSLLNTSENQSWVWKSKNRVLLY